MDTSETYIKMCDCPEIQEQRPVAEDRVGSTYYGWYGIKLHNKKVYSTNRPNETIDSIWLPRQDQLQAMVIAKVSADYANTDISPEHRMVMVFASFVNAVRFPYKIPQNDLTSMEQLQLAFVMHELHNKTWNGERWLRQA